MPEFLQEILLVNENITLYLHSIGLKNIQVCFHGMQVTQKVYNFLPWNLHLWNLCA